MISAVDREGWRAALVGVGSYADARFPAIPAAANNVADLAGLLTAPTGGALAAGHCRALIDPGDAAQVGKAVAVAAAEADDVLLIYYTGHGIVDRRGRLYLTLPGSDYEQPEWSSVPFATLRDELLESRARARVLILDCCFSGRAFEAMTSAAAAVDGQIDVRGTYTITSSVRDETSLAPAGQRHTAFTGALLRAGTEADLTLDQLYRRVEQILHSNGQPRPQRRSVDVTGDLRLFAAGGRPPVPGDVSPHVDAATLFAEGAHCAGDNDLTQAADRWGRAAHLGHTDAMVELGNLHARVRRFEDAEHWFRRAAAAEHTDAMYNLAVILDRTQQYDEAVTWYQKAANTGHTDAMHNLAIRLRYRGQTSEAASWWRNAGHRHPQRAGDKPRGLASRTWSR
ncbi:caspase, EACC1-associated type [Nocardia sp. SSK8]|uniref:caspase, EACC1-associated type n=1 Tax=Nocardia sp. SSK8 TaxID=3120154 RepID=UPI00300B6A81